MKIYEIINTPVLLEDVPPATGEALAGEQFASMKGAISMPNLSMNKSNGSSYMQYRFGIAMAGAPDYPTKAAGAFSGDPLLSTYTDAELEIINSAAKMVGAGPVKRLTTNRSEELSNVNKTSSVAKIKKNKYGV